jgi:hypothetical protein
MKLSYGADDFVNKNTLTITDYIMIMDNQWKFHWILACLPLRAEQNFIMEEFEKHL